jgi:hypothetical protein
MHLLFAHTSVARQVIPHPPQFLASVALSTHCTGVPQLICVGTVPHGKHVPPMQLAVVPHVMPQLPQLSRSLLRSAHEPAAPPSPKPAPQIF